MEGSESPDGNSSDHGRSSRTSAGQNLGINKFHSGKISKVVKRNVIPAAPKQHTPVYTIDKNDFRNVVQKLTGSPASASPPPPPPPPPQQAEVPSNPVQPTSPKGSNPRLQKIRPPPLQPVFSFDKLVPNLAALTTISFPTSHQYISPAKTATVTNPTANVSNPSNSRFQAPSQMFYRPPDSVWAESLQRPVRPRPSMAQPSPPGFNPQYNSSVPSQWPGAVAPSQMMPSRQLQLQSAPPLPSPGSQFSLPPFSPSALFPLSPSAHFGFPGGIGALPLPPSPGSLLPLSPRFPFTSF
jgi:hypothetical protein